MMVDHIDLQVNLLQALTAVWHDEGDGFTPTAAQTEMVRSHYEALVDQLIDAGQEVPESFRVYRQITVGPSIRAASPITWEGASMPNITLAMYRGNLYVQDRDDPFFDLSKAEPANAGLFVLAQQEAFFAAVGLDDVHDGFARSSLNQLNALARAYAPVTVGDGAAFHGLAAWFATPQGKQWMSDKGYPILAGVAGAAIMWKIAGPAIKAELKVWLHGFIRAMGRAGQYAERSVNAVVSHVDDLVRYGSGHGLTPAFAGHGDLRSLDAKGLATRTGSRRPPNTMFMEGKASGMFHGQKFEWVDLNKLVPPSSRPFADPGKVALRGRFNWHKYEPISIRIDKNGVMRIDDGMTRIELARREGITRLPAFVYREH